MSSAAAHAAARPRGFTVQSTQPDRQTTFDASSWRNPNPSNPVSPPDLLGCGKLGSRLEERGVRNRLLLLTVSVVSLNAALLSSAAAETCVTAVAAGLTNVVNSIRSEERRVGDDGGRGGRVGNAPH